ncbi:hypothetical protein MWLf4_2044 [Limosilactobacillus fermentum]|nr:hypothetical protein MWLf4_2044 [Limosilactobacillus fermentum]
MAKTIPGTLAIIIGQSFFGAFQSKTAPTTWREPLFKSYSSISFA